MPPRKLPAPWTLRARWVLTPGRPPLEGGTVTIRGDRILAVEPGGPGRADVDLGEAALLPGLVNAHTHLDLSGLRNRCPPTPDFTDWLRAVIGHRRAAAAEQVAADVRAGLAESLRHGTTLLGDVAAGGVSWPALAAAPLRAVVFHEMIGLTSARAEQALESAGAWLQAHRATDTCRPGLSPHAPYSVRRGLFAQAARLACDFACPLAVHLAESQAELDLLQHRRGPFPDFLAELGVWDPDGPADSLSQVMGLCDQRVPKLFVHGNYLSPFLPFPHDATVVYCPRTHAAFGHPPHPFRDFLARGVRVALGTDSLASNPDLSVLAEVRFLHRLYPDLPGDVLLRMATLDGAAALGWGAQTGSLEPGESADLVAVPLAPGDGDPYRRLLDSDLPVSRVLFCGAWVAPGGAESTGGP